MPTETKKPIEAAWPDAALEARMMACAAKLEECIPTFATDASCHLKALLRRVRELESRLPWLLRCEQAIQVMADLSCYPKETAEQIVGKVLP